MVLPLRAATLALFVACRRAALRSACEFIDLNLLYLLCLCLRYCMLLARLTKVLLALRGRSARRAVMHHLLVRGGSKPPTAPISAAAPRLCIPARVALRCRACRAARLLRVSRCAVAHVEPRGVALAVARLAVFAPHSACCPLGLFHGRACRFACARGGANMRSAAKCARVKAKHAKCNQPPPPPLCLSCLLCVGGVGPPQAVISNLVTARFLSATGWMVGSACMY
jgi:hypothetical protein